MAAEGVNARYCAMRGGGGVMRMAMQVGTAISLALTAALVSRRTAPGTSTVIAKQGLVCVYFSRSCTNISRTGDEAATCWEAQVLTHSSDTPASVKTQVGPSVHARTGSDLVLHAGAAWSGGRSEQPLLFKLAFTVPQEHTEQHLQVVPQLFAPKPRVKGAAQLSLLVAEGPLIRMISGARSPQQTGCTTSVLQCEHC